MTEDYLNHDPSADREHIREDFRATAAVTVTVKGCEHGSSRQTWREVAAKNCYPQ